MKREQILEVANNWVRPSGLVDSEANGRIIAQHIDLWYHGVWSTENLDKVVERLGDRITFNVRTVERIPTQTQEQVNAVYHEWHRTSAPKHLLEDNAANAAILSDYVNSYFANVYTITSLNEAAKYAEGLQYKTAADIAKAAENRMRRDYQDSLNSHKPSEDRAPKKKVLDDAEDIKRVNSNIASTINGYSCNNTNGLGMNYPLTNERRAEMKKIGDGFGKALKEREAALKAVKQRYFSYPS